MALLSYILNGQAYIDVHEVLAFLIFLAVFYLELVFISVQILILKSYVICVLISIHIHVSFFFIIVRGQLSLYIFKSNKPRLITKVHLILDHFLFLLRLFLKSLEYHFQSFLLVLLPFILFLQQSVVCL